MQIVIAIIVVLTWAHAAHAQKEYSLSVSRHQDVPELSEAEVNTILDAASNMLQTNPGVACDVKFTLRGPVRTFGSPDTHISPIVDKYHKDAVHGIDSDVSDVDFHVKVVEGIKDVCRFASDRGFRGCSWPHHFRSLIVVHPNRHRDFLSGKLMSEAFTDKKFPDHLLWAHEFGHLTGLEHRDDPDDPDKDALMHARDVFDYVFHPRSVKVNDNECNCFRSGLLSCQRR
jgi:hypothetical protein